MSKPGVLAKTLVGRRWWWVTLTVIALMVLLARLGFWQLDRLEQRRAANSRLMAAIESAPIELNDTISEYEAIDPGEVSAGLANRDVVMTGAYDYENQRSLKLQSWDGRAGVHLITPFVLGGSDTAVLVNRGWIPDAEYEAGHAFDDARGTQTIRGYVALTEIISRRAAGAVVPISPGDELFRVDIAAIEPELPYELAPFYVKEIVADGSPDSLPIPVPKEVDLSEGPHMDYALQWFVFSIGLGIAYVVYVNRSLRSPKDHITAPESGLSTDK